MGSLWGDTNFVLRVMLDSRGNVVGQIKLMTGLGHRIRDVRVGPDGYVYLLTDDTEGAILRMEPAKIDGHPAHRHD